MAMLDRASFCRRCHSLTPSGNDFLFITLSKQTLKGSFINYVTVVRVCCDVIMCAVTIWGLERGRERVSECATCDATTVSFCREAK